MRLHMLAKKLFFFGVLTVLVSAIFSAIGGPASGGAFIAILPARAAGECVQTPGSIILSVPIPGLQVFYNENCQWYEFGNAADPNLIATYIKGLYKFFVGIAGIIAVFMIVIGGVQWLFSEGNASKIATAKETITGAIIGLLLAAGSYTILRTINPRLVNLVPFAPHINISDERFYNSDGSCKKAEEIPCGFRCVPQKSKGEPIMGECNFCEPAVTNSCGSSPKGKLVAKKNQEKPEGDNCWYAKCSENSACTYVEENAGFLPQATLQFFPQCSGSMPLTYEGKSNTYAFNNSRTGNIFNCGDIIVNTAAPYMPFKEIGSGCSDKSKTCVIDISKGYEWTSSPIPPEGGYSVSNVGHFNKAECIQ